MTRNELQHALACERASEGLRAAIDRLWDLAARDCPKTCPDCGCNLERPRPTSLPIDAR